MLEDVAVTPPLTPAPRAEFKTTLELLLRGSMDGEGDRERFSGSARTAHETLKPERFVRAGLCSPKLFSDLSRFMDWLGERIFNGLGKISRGRRPET